MRFKRFAAIALAFSIFLFVYKDTSLSAEKTYPYWLGIPSNLGASYEHVIVIDQSGLDYPRAYEGTYGVRPVFYLDGYTVEP